MCNAARIGRLLFGSPAPECPNQDAWNAWPLGNARAGNAQSLECLKNCLKRTIEMRQQVALGPRKEIEFYE